MASGEKAKARDIIAAIRTLKAVEQEQRPATAEEKHTLSRFSGFGPVALSIFPDPVTGTYKDAGWQTIGEELQSLLTAQEYDSAKRTTFNAFYTSPVVIAGMHDAIRRLGISGNATILEPGCGIGNFMGQGAAGQHFIGVELDAISGRIARAIYPEADIRIESFRDTKLLEGRIDAVIGNVPFSDLKLDYHGQRLSLHDYFFAKSADALKPGGVLALVTSHYTLDKQNAAIREYLADKADFVGAVRLPSDAFKREGTAVVTDIIFLRKRAPGEPAHHADPDWLGVAPLEIEGVQVPINRYFLNHPEMVLGEWSRKDTLYGGEGYSLTSNGELAGQLKQAIDRLPKFDPIEPSKEEVPAAPAFVPPPPERHIGEGSFFVGDDRVIYQSEGGQGERVVYGGKLLLTAQQFQRASRLICAMEYVRQQHAGELGEAEISTGIWLGGTTTPNTREEARSVLRSLQNGDGREQNKFVLDRCPWCGAEMGPVNLTAGRGRGRRGGVPRVIGYERRDNTVVYACPDRRCEFHGLLPLYVIDEDIYEKRPDLVIGTVDKFAMLAWKPQARALFGIAEDGTRAYSPPGLIIQDELHLISGPLGSMVGLYEPIIEELCTDRRGQQAAKPKIVSSTATIRSYSEQVQGLYARDRTSLFPPPGLDAADSFFARVARRADGTLERGRIYAGVHAPGLGSLQTVQVRTFSALLQAPQPMAAADRDPWWTLLLFFNSLHELGTTLTLFQSDIPDLLRGALRQRLGISFQDVRQLRKILELTGRLPGDEVPKAISALEVPTVSQQGQAVDVCLASNIIEVGVDIDRLSLMAVVGQPKTTSQYIQVTGRVGRKSDQPGLVVTIYTASKPRDRSHFEKFRSYHERLYAQVEPTSVTPFSRPALDRAAHAVIASYVRQLGDSDQAESPYPFPASLVAAVSHILDQRAATVDPDELAALRRIIQRRGDEWQRWQRLKWDGAIHAEDMPLMRPAGAYVTPENARVSWATPQSLRNVDAECQAEITRLYMLEEEEEAGDA
jgi:hypothetical protein